MIKRGKDTKKASTLELMIHKYAGKEGKGSYKDKIKSMDGFMKMDGKAFCFQNNAQAKKALAVAEQAANFLNWQVMKGDGCFKLMEVGMDKKANVLEQMIYKYAGEESSGLKKILNLDEKFLNLDTYGNEFGPLPESTDEAVKPGAFTFVTESPREKELAGAYNKGFTDGLYGKWRGEAYEHDPELLDAYSEGNIKGEENEKNYYGKTSNLQTMIKKYAKEDWEISSEEAYEPFANTDVDPLKFDDVFDAMGRGFEDGMRHPDDKKNPYNPVEHDDSLVKAYNDGFESALDQHTRNMSRGM